MAKLTHGQFLKVHQALLAVGLVDSRDALLVGIDPALVSSLMRVSKPADQLLCDLNGLNIIAPADGGAAPIELWLRNAIHLAGPRAEVAVFHQALEALHVKTPRTLQTPATNAQVSRAVPHNSKESSDEGNELRLSDPDEVSADDHPFPLSDVDLDIGVQGDSSIRRPSSLQIGTAGDRDRSDAPTRVLRRLAAIGALRFGIARPKERWARILTKAPPALLDCWLDAFERMPDDVGAATLHIASMWSNAAVLGLAPRIRALEGRPNIQTFGEFSRDKKLAWRCTPRGIVERIGPTTRAQTADYRWLDGSWSASQPLSGPLFEITWDTLYTLHRGTLGAGGVAPTWWYAAGGLVGDDERTIAPWPGLNLPTFSELDDLTEQWNQAYEKAAKLHRLISDNGAVDDLAHWYVNYCHNLWHRNIDTSWATEVTLRDWGGTISCLLRSVASTPASESNCYAAWARALPILAAPESGLSNDVASTILEASSLDASRKEELRALRKTRLREALATGNEDELIAAIDARHLDHPWVRQLEDSGH